MSYMYGTASVVCHFPFGKPLVKNIFFRSFPKKKRSDCESQKSGFGFDLKNPSRVWILWIHDPFLDSRKQTPNRFLDSEIRIWVFPKNVPLVEFDWEIRIQILKSGFRILQSNAKSKNGLHLREIRPQNGFKLRNPNPDFVDFLFTVRLGNPKKDLQNSGLLFANYTCACKTAVVIRTVFQILYWISNRMVKMKIQKQISQR